MFYKAENGELIAAPENGIKIFIANPTKEQYALFGFTDTIKEDEMPVATEGKVVESYYEQSGTIIYKRYRLKDLNDDNCNNGSETPKEDEGI